MKFIQVYFLLLLSLVVHGKGQLRIFLGLWYLPCLEPVICCEGTEGWGINILWNQRSFVDTLDPPRHFCGLSTLTKKTSSNQLHKLKPLIVLISALLHICNHSCPSEGGSNYWSLPKMISAGSISNGEIFFAPGSKGFSMKRNFPDAQEGSFPAVLRTLILPPLYLAAARNIHPKSHGGIAA